MTTIWRDIEGVTAYRSGNDVEFLNMTFHIVFFYDFKDNEVRLHAYYKIDGDIIQSFTRNIEEEIPELGNWISNSIEKEISVNKAELKKEPK